MESNLLHSGAKGFDINPRYVARSRLTPAEVAAFDRDGYLVYAKQVFSEAKFTRLRRHFDRMLLASPPGVRPEELDVPHFTDPRLFEWLLDDAVLDLVEPLLGPDIALFSSHFLCKPPTTGKRVPWHEDSFYWRTMLEPMQVVTVWLAIDPADAENGAMKVIPGTHRKPDSDYEPVDPAINVFSIEIKREQLDPSRAVTLELRPGEASLHQAALAHGSDPNRSERRRCGYTMRYISTRSRFNREAFGDFHQIYLARGRDRAGNLYADPGRVYPELLERRKKKIRKGH